MMRSERNDWRGQLFWVETIMTFLVLIVLSERHRIFMTDLHLPQVCVIFTFSCQISPTNTRQCVAIHLYMFFSVDMAVQNFIGDALRGATWVALHNGGGVGWGQVDFSSFQMSFKLVNWQLLVNYHKLFPLRTTQVINGGFGMLLDGSKDAYDKATELLSWDVNNGVARRAWSGNKIYTLPIPP